MTESNTRASLSSSSSSFGARNSASSTGCWCFVVFERYRSWILYSLSFVIVSLAAGIVYGWPALRHQLLVDENGSTLSEEQCGLIYTIGAWSTQGGRFFAGIARDKYGTKYITCGALCSVMLGLIGVGLSDPNDLVVLCLSFFFIGLGSAAQLCVQPVAGLFPHHTGIVLSSLSGAFQLSGLVLLVVSKYQRIMAFLIFAGIILVVTIIAAILLPMGGSFVVQQDSSNQEQEQEEEDTTNSGGNHDDKEGTEIDLHDTVLTTANNYEEVGRSLVNNKTEKRNEGKTEEIIIRDEPAGRDVASVDRNKQEEQNTTNTQVDKNTKHRTKIIAMEATLIPAYDDSIEDNTNERPPTAFEQMKTKEYILLCTWFSITIIPLQYYVAIIGYVLEEMGNAAEGGLYTDVFAYTYAGAAILSPIAGYIADQYGLGIAQGVSTLLVAVSLFVLGASESISLKGQTLGMVLYGIGRMGIFGVFFVNCGKRFGYTNYGTLAGLGLLTSAFSSLLQYPLIAWTTSVRGNGALVQNSLGAILIVQAPYFVWLYRREWCYDSAISRNCKEQDE